MSRLIDADALRLGICRNQCGKDGRDCQCTEVQYVDNAPTVNRWISVKDRLPDIGEVITAVKYSGNSVIFVQTGEWTGERWISIWDQYTAPDAKKEVLYWMPLPEPPKEVKK